MQLPWYVVLGNHDHYGNATAQVAYAAEGRGSGRWKLPALSSPTADRAYYDFTRTLGGVKVHVVVLDTVVLAGDCFPGPGGEACAPPKLTEAARSSPKRRRSAPKLLEAHGSAAEAPPKRRRSYSTASTGICPVTAICSSCAGTSGG